VVLLGKNRDRVSLVAAILEAARLGASKTKIMFSAGLSFSLLEKYLDIVTCTGFVRMEGSRYVLTERGREFLRQYKNFEERYLRAEKLFDALISERERLTQYCEGPKLLQSIRQP
jgi:predicted transcriptional regulator